MALTNSARNKLFRLVQQSKKLLYQEISDQLQLHYGILPKDGKVLLIEELTTSDADLIYTGKLLRDRLNYLATNLADPNDRTKGSIDQLIREQAFSILNRMAALRMAEERGIVKETVGKFYNSEGFQVYDSITGQGATTTTYTRYKWYIHAIFDELALDLPSIFDRFSPYALIFPSEKALESLLEIINNEDVAVHREDGLQALNLWKQDETIGWIYQYYNSKEEIKTMREASDAPRNSQELAVRNQFFTPRYVVQFLTDNSLGRIWYEMTKGETELVTICKFLIRKPKEVFLDKGHARPESSDEVADYIDHRAVKDPREILMLDPACGSMHFGLYSFDLLEIIYREAWDDFPELLTDLRLKMTRQQFLHQIPEFVIRYNIHGIDIDPRALQIAALSLWLKAQKSFEKLGLPAVNRPSITRSNLVLAEAMPGNAALLSEMVMPLEKPMRQLMLAIWEKMQLAGETGLLLRIENEIDEAIKKIAEELSEETKGAQLKLGSSESESQAAEKSALYATKKYRDDFLTNAESQVLDLLKQLAEIATNGDAYQKLLFADDTARGFSFIEICRKRYDVILMNPPFGAPTISTLNYLRQHYPYSSDNLYLQFLERCLWLLAKGGKISELSDRSFINKSSYQKFRKEIIIARNTIEVLVDFGENVLDGAFVDVAAHIHSENNSKGDCLFINLLNEKLNKEQVLIDRLSEDDYTISEIEKFKEFPNSAFVYDLSPSLLAIVHSGKEVSKELFESFSGLKSGDAEQTNRLFWEPNIDDIGETRSWMFFQNGSPFSPYYFGCVMVVRSDGMDFTTIKTKNSARITGIEYYLREGISFGERTDWMYGYKMREKEIFSINGHAIFPKKNVSIYYALLIINSSPFQEIVNHLCGQHKGGYINPIRIDPTQFPDKSDELRHFILELEQMDMGNETSLVFEYPTSLSFLDVPLDIAITKTTEWRRILIDSVNDFRQQYNSILESQLRWIPNGKVAKKNVDYCNVLFDHGNDQILESANIVSYLLGVLFGRWDITLPQHKKHFDLNGNDFGPLNIVSPGMLPPNSNLRNDYPVDVAWNGILTQDTSDSNELASKLSRSINALWGTKTQSAELDLVRLLNVNSINQYFLNPNLFFDFHLRRYSKNKRNAPIYWPLSTRSGAYIIWIYYPKLNDQTLYQIVNNFIKPKQSAIEDSIRRLEQRSNLDNKGKKELAELQEFLTELGEMEKEILWIATLPYKPNHDDGVLITAAPLHKLFRHNKWRNLTTECWKSLEKGDYDWANLAYSIWPDRVIKKCKKDLSLAVAHRLEKICEVKAKEKKIRAKKEPQEIKKDLKLDL